VDLKGRCISCGFLAKRSIDPTPSYYEIEQSERDTGHVWQHHGAETGIYIQTEPECFRHVASIRGEIQQIPDNNADKSAAAKRVFSKDRECEYWYPYTLGLTPKEHLEEVKMQLLENSRRDFELRLFKITEQIQKDSRKIATRSFWFNLFFTLVLIFLTCVQIWLAVGENRLIFARLLEQLFKLLILKLS
jgi:hypothetical protein